MPTPADIASAAAFASILEGTWLTKALFQYFVLECDDRRGVHHNP